MRIFAENSTLLRAMLTVIHTQRFAKGGSERGSCECQTGGRFDIKAVRRRWRIDDPESIAHRRPASIAREKASKRKKKLPAAPRSEGKEKMKSIVDAQKERVAKKDAVVNAEKLHKGATVYSTLQIRRRPWAVSLQKRSEKDCA